MCKITFYGKRNLSELEKLLNSFIDNYLKENIENIQYVLSNKFFLEKHEPVVQRGCTHHFLGQKLR